MNSKILHDINSYGRPAQGRKEYIAYLEGKSITHKQAVLAHCYSCTNFYVDGKVVCEIPHCPLFSFMPYNKNKVKVKKERTERQKKQALKLAIYRSKAARS